MLPNAGRNQNGKFIFPAGRQVREAGDIARSLNRELGKKGIRAIPIRRPKGEQLVLLVRPNSLKRDFESPLANEILCRKGYHSKSPERVLSELVRRMARDETFPHEIGLFLGYPPEDVKCFMEHPNEGVQCVGCWKAYGNKERAEAVFKKYRRCAEIYKREYQKGRPLERLVVRTA